MFAGNPIGDVEFINEEVKKKVETCAKRLDVIKEFASTTDEPASPFRGFYKHLSLGLIQLCCDRRLDYALQVVPSGWINSEHLAKAANDIRSAVSHATNGEIDFAALDAVGKHLFQMPHRLGGQNFHDISNEAPFCFLGNIAAHAHLVKEKLEKFDNSLMEKLELKLALSEEPNWIGGIIGALDGIKDPPQSFHSSRLCVMQEESLGLYHFHQGCATSGQSSSVTNTEDRTLTQESGDVRSVEFLVVFAQCQLQFQFLHE